MVGQRVDSFFCFISVPVAVSLLSFAIEGIGSSPTRIERWQQPCRGRTATSQTLLVTPSPTPDADLVVADRLSIKSQELMLLTNRIKNTYVSLTDYNCVN